MKRDIDVQGGATIINASPQSRIAAFQRWTRSGARGHPGSKGGMIKLLFHNIPLGLQIRFTTTSPPGRHGRDLIRVRIDDVERELTVLRKGSFIIGRRV